MSKISIVTPVFNSERFIDQCISSIKAQTFLDWEHILVDDCSTDNSPVIIKNYAEKDSRIKYFKLSEKGGPGIARNKGIELSKGRYIAFLDSDDLWNSDKLTLQLAFMEKNGYPFTFTSYNRITEDGSKLNGIIKAETVVTYKRALLKNPIGCLTVMYDVSYFGKQYMPSIVKRQDYALWLKLLKQSNAYGLDKVLATYRVRQNSVSSGKIGLLKYEWKIYREEEGLSFTKSSFYLLTAILGKLRSYF